MNIARFFLMPPTDLPAGLAKRVKTLAKQMGICRGKFALKSEVKFSPAARAKFGFRRAKLTAYAVSEIAASGSSDKVPQPFGLPFFFTTAVPAVISLSSQRIISLMAPAMNFAARQGNFACGQRPHIFSPSTSHLPHYTAPFRNSRIHAYSETSGTHHPGNSPARRHPFHRNRHTCNASPPAPACRNTHG